ncbi:hypothetical protein WN943_003334 [Citrus x changshan-huyou]
MQFEAGISLSRGAAVTEGPSLSPSLNQDALWQMNLRTNEAMESGSLPERPGEPDCSYYIRTGLCRFGATCRFNHPPNRKLAIATARIKGDYPERLGQPECQWSCTHPLLCAYRVQPDWDMVLGFPFSGLPHVSGIYFYRESIVFSFWDSSQYYLKTGTCKFGATCKFHHPRDKAGIAGRVSLNVLGYPLRPNEIECAYYLRTGQCKFGSTCKFHHPQPNNMMVSLRGSPVYPTVQSPTTPSQQSYAGGITNWSRASFIPSPRWQGPSSYAPMLLPQGMVSVPGWNTYSGQLGSVSSSENLQQTSGNSQIYGASRQTEPSNSGSQGTMSPFRSGSIPVGFYALQRESVFPERPGQPECQFYMKTGDCKFGAVCRFHHPRERLLPVPDCVLSPIGLPLRPPKLLAYAMGLLSGTERTFTVYAEDATETLNLIISHAFMGEPLCIFYSRYGICKFGPSCKFDHPMGIFTYNLSASSSADAPVRRFLGSSSATGALNLSSEGLVEAGSGRRLSLPETRQMSSGDDEIDTEG